MAKAEADANPPRKAAKAAKDSRPTNPSAKAAKAKGRPNRQLGQAPRGQVATKAGLTGGGRKATTTDRLTASDEWTRRQDLHELAQQSLANLAAVLTLDRRPLIARLHRPAEEVMDSLTTAEAGIINSLTMTSQPDSNGHRWITRVQFVNPILAARDVLDVCVSVLAEDRLRGQGPDAYLDAPPPPSSLLPIGQLKGVPAGVAPVSVKAGKGRKPVVEAKAGHSRTQRRKAAKQKAQG